ncbi:MAG: hypothetical protein HY216_07775 [Candidatus Rokubacteria bacterium]|nr:hypothetical protein [Candidatus Rokubacteria bacterium]
MTMRAMGFGLLMVAITGVTLLGGATAQDTCRLEGDTHVCRTEGFGTIINNDRDQARDEARTDARRRAVEQVAGVQLDAETITRNQVLFDQLVRSQARGVVDRDRVVDEGMAGEGRYRVKIEAWVKQSDLQAQIAANASEVSMIVELPEKNLDQDHPQRFVQNAVIAKLSEAEFRVMDPEQLKRVTARDRLAAIARGDTQALREGQRKFLANLFVVGDVGTRFSQNNSGVVSAYAQVTAKLIEAETGRILKVVTLPQVRGFARDEVGAGERALMEASNTTADQLVEAVKSYLKIKERDVDVRFRGLPTLDEYRRAKAFLEKVRFVNGVTDRGYAPADSSLVVKYPEKTIFLAARLRQEKNYNVVEVDRNRVLVDYKP